MPRPSVGFSRLPSVCRSFDLVVRSTGFPYDPQPLSNSCDLVLPCHRRVFTADLLLALTAAILRRAGPLALRGAAAEQAARVSSGGTAAAAAHAQLLAPAENARSRCRGFPAIRPVGPGNRGSLARGHYHAATPGSAGLRSLKEILTQHNSEMPAPMAQMVREQCLAQLLAPALSASTAGERSRPIRPVATAASDATATSSLPTVAAATEEPRQPPSPALPARVSTGRRVNRPAQLRPRILRASRGLRGRRRRLSSKSPAEMVADLAESESPAVEELKAGQWQERLQLATETLEKELARFKHDAEETARAQRHLATALRGRQSARAGRVHPSRG